MAIVEDTLRIAQVMPDYDIERELGRGGMGVVFLGRHRRLQRGAAIKELPPSFSSEIEVRERFATEAKTLAGLAHPHIVPIFDYVERDGLCLIVMQELPGGSVWDRFTTTGLTPPTACAVVMACCAALQHAHDKGVLHLDVKPDNLMFDAESAVKVTDFGIARVITGGRTMGTVDGQVLGTPAYMSPEQARGDDLTAASDVYAAGVMLYELLSGQLPWQGAETASELLTQRLEEDPIPLRDVSPGIPPMLADVVMTSLSRDVESRYARAEDFGVAIGQACAESWGPGWLDHAGVAIVGSERLSMAARTTSHHADVVAAPAPESPPPPTESTTGVGAAGSTVTGAHSSVPEASSTIITSKADTAVPGAAETGVAGQPVATPPGANETTARSVTPPPAAAPATGASAPAAPATAAPATGVSMPAAPATGSVPPVAPVDGAAGSVTSPESSVDADQQPMAFAVMRAASAEPRIRGADLYDLELADLIGVRDVLDPPKTPWPSLIVTAALFAMAAVIALAGIGDNDRGGTFERGQVEVAGVDVSSGSRADVDLSSPVDVRVDDRALAADADEVEIEFSYLGVPVGSSSGALRDGEAAIDPGIVQRMVGGHATGTVRLLARDEVVGEQDVGVDATQAWYLTAPFAIGALLLLLAYANLESSLKPLRSGHTRMRSYLGAPVWCALGGFGFVLLLAAMGLAEPTIMAAALVGLISGAAGVALVRARLGVARRRRIRKAVKRAQKRIDVTINA